MPRRQAWLAAYSSGITACDQEVQHKVTQHFPCHHKPRRGMSIQALLLLLPHFEHHLRQQVVPVTQLKREAA